VNRIAFCIGTNKICSGASEIHCGNAVRHIVCKSRSKAAKAHNFRKHLKSSVNSGMRKTTWDMFKSFLRLLSRDANKRVVSGF